MDKSHYLSNLFSPSSIAVIGSYDSTRLLWQTILAHLLDTNNFNKIIPINISNKNMMIGNLKVYRSLSEVENPERIDVIIVTLMISYYPKIVKLCNKYNIKYIIFMKSQSYIDDKDKLIISKAQKLASIHGIRLLGVGYIGLIRPLGIMATVYKHKILSGNIALISQSSGICWSLLEWAYSKKIGFSTILSLVDIVTDIEFGEVLDFLIHDKNTSSIILHIDHVNNLKMLLNSLRYVSRIKPLIVIKTGRFRGIYIDNFLKENINISFDNIFTDVLTGLGVMQIHSFDKLFTTIRILASNYRVRGDRLAIISNGSGLGVLAADRAHDLNIRLSEFNTNTISSLKKLTSIDSGVVNPINIKTRSGPSIFKLVINLCLEDDTVDGILVACSPTSKNDSLSIARVISRLQDSSKKPILLCWVENFNNDIDNIFCSNNVRLHFDTPEQAVEAFYNLVMITSTQKITRYIPQKVHKNIDNYNYSKINTIINKLRKSKDKTRILPEYISRDILRSFNINCGDIWVVNSKDEAVDIALKIGFPLLMKLDYSNIDCKKNIDTNIVLNINSTDQLEDSYYLLLEKNISNNISGIKNICLQKMFSTIEAREVIISVVNDNLFGPVIVFGSGCSSLDFVLDRSFSIPPLNDILIKFLKGSTAVGKKLIEEGFIDKEGYSDLLSNLLYSISDLIVEYKQIRELLIRLLLYKDNLLIIDSKIILHDKLDIPDKLVGKYDHMVIKPYPRHLEKQIKLKDGIFITIRPIRLFDSVLFQNFFKNLSDKSRYRRFMFHIKEINNNFLINLTQVNFDRDMGLVAVKRDIKGNDIIIGHSLYIRDLNLSSCEFAIVIDDKWQGIGLGTIMMEYLFEIAISNNIKYMRGQIFEDNISMYKLVKKLGFKLEKDINEGSIIFLEKSLIKTNK